ncbi:pro-sigmaK processing inhibitor BofA family protein [Laceyella sacchari]|jgi:inhibitor of the pro-sigma K processing machinery|uniref:Pro-sigmaK processing inhibitor BofA family protein n=1 Tax=Laceyella sacchari TaxID=37482 RepID=A0ABY5U623_LACSH|nr:pro-sigmaK processing inhibitor BofA family protein [Laceyella sacchari]TCW39441.1 inhibitor of the pro-sigma K processing machinery [Laceyella sacchari]UWE03737.1 pro-sigmaK processing inhibitor BofA family protein [Laceyella sacchari]
MMDIKWWVFALVGAVVVFMVINRSVTQPLYWIWQGFLYSAIGGLVLFLINLVGQYVHFHIPINPVTAIVAGMLGAPGVLYLVAVKLIFVA